MDDDLTPPLKQIKEVNAAYIDALIRELLKDVDARLWDEADQRIVHGE